MVLSEGVCMSLDIKEVIQIARAQFTELLPELSIHNTADVRVEEIVREGENWAITFSVPNPKFSNPAAAPMGGSPFYGARIAKVVVVDGSKGQFLALRERAA
jgi:hypothetical protein